MKHETQVATIHELLDRLANHTVPDAGQVLSCPMTAFTDPDRAAREREALFLSHPQMLGLSGELPGPGSYISSNDFGVPILATRDREGKFHVFVNACRHRGAQLVLDKRGTAPRFTCPYHAWTYGDDGRLLSVRESSLFGDIDKACNGLIELPSEEKYGLLFFHPRREGVLDIDALLGSELAGELATWQLERCVYAAEFELDRPPNWKLASDTFCEAYHFPVLHHATAGNVVHGDFITYRTFGANHCMIVPNKNIQTVREKREEGWQLATVAVAAYYLFPNVHLILSGNVISMTRIFPDPERPGHSFSRVSIYRSEHLLDGLDKDESLSLSGENIYTTDMSRPVVLDASALLEMFDTTVDKEDYRIACQIQETANSGLIEAVKFGRNEPGVQHAHNQILAAIGLPPLRPHSDAKSPERVAEEV